MNKYPKIFVENSLGRHSVQQKKSIFYLQKSENKTALLARPEVKSVLHAVYIAHKGGHHHLPLVCNTLQEGTAPEEFDQ